MTHVDTRTPAEDTATAYLQAAGQHSLLTHEEEISLGRNVLKGCFESRQKMITSNLRLVVNLSKRYKNRGVPLIDLIEEGNLGLIRAVEGFDPERGLRFSTYAAWWIRQHLENAIVDMSRSVRLPDEVHRHIGKINRHLEEGGGNSAESISSLLDISLKRARLLLRTPYRTVSTDSEDGESYSINSKVSSRPDFDGNIYHEEVHDLIDEFIDKLNERERYILSSRFGLRGEQEKTLAEIGAELGLTHERVRQIEKGLFIKMRPYLRRHEMRDAESIAI